MALARHHELDVLTHGGNREAIEHELAHHPLKNKVRFHYLRPRIQWNENRMIARFQDWWDYHKWCVQARELARSLIEQNAYDVAHHITFATWRVAPPLAGLGLPLVMGPVGGGEVFPRKFFSILSPTSKAFELARMASNRIAANNPKLRQALASADVLLPNNDETAQILHKAGADGERMMIATQSFLTPQKIELFDSWRARRTAYDGGTLRIFAGGNLEGRKGVAIALKALGRLRGSGVPCEFLYGGHGPELAHLLRLRDTLQLQDNVRFESMLQKDLYLEALHGSHIYLLPSLREGCPITLLEAMMAGCVPIVADCGGQAVAVTDACGLKVKPTSPESMEQAIADAVTRLHHAPELWSCLSSGATERVRSGFSEAGYLESMHKAYARIGFILPPAM